MRTILVIIIKEIKQIFRDKGMLPLIFVMPFIQLIILANAVTFEIKNINFSVVDSDKTEASRNLISKFTANGFFKLYENAENTAFSEKSLYENKADISIIIPNNFEKNIITNSKLKLQILVNAIDGSRAQVVQGYATSIVNSFYNNYLQLKKIPYNPETKTIEIVFSNWYNVPLNYKTIMVPGILVILVSIIGMFLASMSIAKEKEIGTIEQLNVTPILKYQLIIGKIAPVWLIGVMEFTIGLIVAVNAFDLTISGSIPLIYLFAGIYLVVMLAFGIIISTISDTQQQAMFLCWFFLVIFILLSGIFTPIDNMPDWAQMISKCIPLTYFIEALRNIMLKASEFKDLSANFYSLLIYAAGLIVFAFWKYKKTS